MLGTLFLFIYECIDFKNVPLLTLLLEPVILKETYFGMEMKKKEKGAVKLELCFECLPCARHSLRSLIDISGA